MDGRQLHPAPASGSLSLVIPAYNEAAGIREAVTEADRALAGIMNDYEILVVDDGSSDDTADTVRAVLRDRPHVRLLRHGSNRGYGAALRTGFEAARGEQVAFTDADGQFDLADLGSLLRQSADVPIVVGFRIDRQDPWQRRFISWGYNTLVRTFLGTRVRDCDCALKVFRREALGALLPETSGFFVNTEMLTRARQLGYPIKEVGVRHRPRLRGASKVSLADIPRTLAALLPFWWSRVLFPGDGSSAPQPPARIEPTPRDSLAWWLGCVLTVMAALLFFSRLGCPLQEPEEPRYAEIARQMWQANEFVVPLLHGQPYYDKPPLLYWLIMASYSLFDVHDWSARLVSCAAAFCTVIVTFFWGKHVVGARAAFAGALMLCLSARFVYLGRLLTTNILLCLWVVTALAAAHAALRGPSLRRGWWLLSAAACGLGILTKGPVALVLAAVPMLVYVALDPRVPQPRLSAWLGYAAAALAVAAPWYVLVLARDPGFGTYFFWQHNVVRFVAPFDHEEPVWFYLPSLLLGMLPWSLLLVPLAKSLRGVAVEAGANRPPALGFFLLASAWCFLFFSLAGCKRSGYILPAMPPLALALGCYLDCVLVSEARNWARQMPWGAGAHFGYRLTLLVFGAGIGGSLLAMAAGVLKPAAGVALIGSSAVGFAAIYYRGRGWRPETSWLVCGATAFTLLLAAVHLALPAYARRFSLRGHLRPQAAFCADASIPVVCYPRCWDSVGFYLRRSDVRTYPPENRRELMTELSAQPRALVVVKGGRVFQEFVGELPAFLEFVPCGRGGTVHVGVVRAREEAPRTLFAGR
jgi:dolichol-phosphate mannosyltransferase